MTDTDNDNTEPIKVTYTDGSAAYLPATGTERWAPYGSDEYVQQLVGDDPDSQAMVRHTMELFRRGFGGTA